MEIINQTPPPIPKFKRSAMQCGYIYTGVALIAAGVMWLLHNLDVLPHCIESIVFSWQFLLMVVGGFLMITGNMKAGIITMVMGLLFLLYDQIFYNVPFAQVFLPIVCIVGGILILTIKRR